MSLAIPLAAPHAHSQSRTQSVMFTVALAIAPATAFGFYTFGYPAFNLWVVTVLTGLLVEAVALKMRGMSIPHGLSDGSALLASWLLALTLPPWAPWWVGALGAFFAIAGGKHVFGGLGQNVFNPAMVGRVALLLAFPRAMTEWPRAMILDPVRLDPMTGLRVTFGIDRSTVDALSGATTLDAVKIAASEGQSIADVFSLEQNGIAHTLVGSTAGSLGETSAVFVLAGGILLLLRKVISWQIPVAMLGTLAALSAAMHLIDPSRYMGAEYHLTTGAAMITAFFIATDPVTSPSTGRGRLIFGAGLGLMVYTIRTWGTFPEGAAFAVLLMNAMVPYVDVKVRPRRYGRDKSGEPLALEKALGGAK